ncbi:cob(I)yrinic acid a,c-diamide adenosyltransferase [Bacillus carboniphilus]|uniref:Corrinoid adenosyltransferase n=1 Tax=Bacillus carboniphilus TaxID=86663 RepID=A0ABY9JWK0_9BACI|nr:cob(I)yrinic acid a,c-diamide adenosyltransferase [Bacillus carboniphilus]WLR43777.1 cob(I)yrinic acid a,c-diamide adenosyltransferase [Bacillus carboniphilus]
MKIYTRSGDEGKTSLIGARVDKDDLRVEAYGTIDEVNCLIGQAMAELPKEQFSRIYNELQKIQHELFDCGSDLAVVYEKNKHPFKTTQAMIDDLEKRIDDYVDEAPALEKFILPGGSKSATLIHSARAVTRRAERQIVSLKREHQIHNLVLMYINRLSDYLFALARVINYRLQVNDVEYERSAIVFKTDKSS